MTCPDHPDGCPVYPGFRISQIVAFTTIGPDDEEGVMAFHDGNTWMPMIAADPRRLEQLRDIARRLDPTGNYTERTFVPAEERDAWRDR